MSFAISNKKSSSPLGCLIAFVGIFTVIAFGIFVANCAIPLWKLWRVQSWTVTTCVIQSSTIASRGSGDDLKFSPEIRYSYLANNRTYSANQWSPFDMSRRRYRDSQALVAAFPEGAQMQCFVNPNQPEQAFLDRSIPSGFIMSLLPLAFAMCGMGAISWLALHARRNKENHSRGAAHWQPKATSGSALGSDVTYALPGDNAGKVVLKPMSTRAGGCIGIGLFSLFWNGFIGFAFWQVMFATKSSGFSQIFSGLFFIPFILIGLMLLLATFTSFISLFSSRPELTMSTPLVIPGNSFELSWEIKKALLNPQNWSLTLEAREEATYTRGTDTFTDKSVFFSQQIAAATSFEMMKIGRQTVTIPEGAMHSFSMAHNKIIWSIKVQGAPAFGGALKEEFEIIVAPAPSRGRVEYSA